MFKRLAHLALAAGLVVHAASAFAQSAREIVAAADKVRNASQPFRTTLALTEYVRGEDLGAIVRRDGPMPFARVAPIFEQICAALAEAHEVGIIHRDLKPENVLVTRSKEGRDVVKVVDFGLAKVREREEMNEVTGRGNLIGTPYYMSPEQIRSEPIDGRSDVYSLGAMLYRVLTGEPPFSGATPIGVLTKPWKPKKNVELIAELRTICRQFSDLPFVKVAGHSGIPLNERTDQLAREAIVRRHSSR